MWQPWNTEGAAVCVTQADNGNCTRVAIADCAMVLSSYRLPSVTSGNSYINIGGLPRLGRSPFYEVVQIGFIEHWTILLAPTYMCRVPAVQLQYAHALLHNYLQYARSIRHWGSTFVEY